MCFKKMCLNTQRSYYNRTCSSIGIRFICDRGLYPSTTVKKQLNNRKKNIKKQNPNKIAITFHNLLLFLLFI